MLRGEVHDENAWALGGVAGHAGLFSTAGDLAVFCRTLLAGGAYGPARVLGPDHVDLMLRAPGLGFAVDQPWFMGALAGRGAAGHTGFTGTSLVLDRATDTFVVLLANTVHPRRPAPPDSTPAQTRRPGWRGRCGEVWGLRLLAAPAAAGQARVRTGGRIRRPWAVSRIAG